MSPHLKGSENFLGKKFEGNFINSTISNPLIDVIQFERILNGKPSASPAFGEPWRIWRQIPDTLELRQREG